MSEDSQTPASEEVSGPVSRPNQFSLRFLLIVLTATFCISVSFAEEEAKLVTPRITKTGRLHRAVVLVGKAPATFTLQTPADRTIRPLRVVWRNLDDRVALLSQVDDRAPQTS